MNKAYLINHKSAFDPAHLVFITMDGIVQIFPASVTASSTAFLPHLLLICDTKDSRWREQTTDNDMLRQSIMASEGGDDPKYTSTYLEAVINGDTMWICVKEATNSILRWMDITGDISSMIRTTCPTYMRGQPLKIFFSSGPAEYDKHYTMWLRNTLIMDFPENKYHVVVVVRTPQGRSRNG
jgi:hypothetical protein